MNSYLRRVGIVYLTILLGYNTINIPLGLVLEFQMNTQTQQKQSSREVETNDPSLLFNNIFNGLDILTPVDYLTAVREGITGHELRDIAKTIGNRELIARSIGRDPSNLSRAYQVKHLSQIASDSVVDIARVYLQAARVYGSIELAKKWMSLPIPALGGEIPEKLIDSHAGRELVRQTLKKMEFGEYI